MGARLLDLDDVPATRDAVAADPATFVAGPGPVCIDEYQHVPLVLDAIKAELNRDGRPGRFVLTGSARHESLPAAAQALDRTAPPAPGVPAVTGRDRRSRRTTARQALRRRVRRGAACDRRARAARSTSNGSSQGAFRSLGPRHGSRPSPMVRRLRAPHVRARTSGSSPGSSKATSFLSCLQRLAGQTGQVLNLTRAAQASARRASETADNYIPLARERCSWCERLPAWGTTLMAGAASHPKIHVVDSGVAARLLRLTPEKLAATGPDGAHRARAPPRDVRGRGARQAGVVARRDRRPRPLEDPRR